MPTSSMTSSLDSERRDRYHRTMSTSVQRLQDALNIHLDVSEKTEFVDILNEFHINRDIAEFVKRLKLLLDTPAKTELLALIKKVIPQSDVMEFAQCLRLKGKRFDTMPVKQPKKQRSRPPLTATDTAGHWKSKVHKKEKSDKSKEANQRDNAKSSGTKGGIGIESPKHLKSSLEHGQYDLKQIQICQSSDIEGGFGFSIRGGAEYGIGIYVSMVDRGGMAEKEGLVPGDLIMEVNNISFNNIPHDEAAKIIRSSKKLDIVISHVGRIPGSFVVHQMYKWVNGSGRPVSPPPELEHLGQVDSIGKKSGFALLKGPDERKISVTVENGESLGLMIRGGREFGLGIYTSGVDQGSLADQAAIKIGDQILDVNGRSFLDITHADAVHVLKTSKFLIFTLKNVGKLPYARTKIDQTSWMSKTQHRKHRCRTDSQMSGGSHTLTSSKSSAFRKGIGSQLMYNTAIGSKWDVIENQALQLLNDSEQGTLRYYLSEYQAGFITVDGLAMASFELLNTKAKMNLMGEIRKWVQTRDLDKFDILLQRRQAQQRESNRTEKRPGINLHSYSTSSPDGHNPHLSRRLHRSYKAMSAPVSRTATVRERSGRGQKQVAEWELEPLRQAIQQIDDQFQADQEYKHNRKSAFQRQRSLSTEFLHSTNLLKSSVSSRQSLSDETLTPVYIDTTSDLPPSPAHTPYSRSRSNNASQKKRTLYSHAHRQRSGSNSSSLRRKYRSIEDVRSPDRKIMPYPSHWNSTEDVHRNLSSVSYSQLTDLDTSHRPSHTTCSVYVDVHEQPVFAATGQQVDGSPSDDSGVEVNGHITSDSSRNRVTISPDNPVNINDVLHSRSFVIPSSHDQSIHSNHSTLTNHSRQSHKSVSAVSNQRKDDIICATSSPKFSSSTNRYLQPPVEIRINDGEGSMDTINFESHSSTRFLNQSKIGYAQETLRGSRRTSMLNTDDEDDEADVEDQDTLEISSEIEDHADFCVTSLQRSPYDTYRDSRKIKDAKKKYGDVPMYIIPVYKTKPTLGMAIEGGANTRQPVPRVINLQPGGSAYESGGLRVGHKILEVNGKSLIGLEHITAAKTVAEAFKNNNEDNMELLVTESDAVLNK